MYISTCNWNYTPKCGLLQPWVARTSSWWKKSFPCHCKEMFSNNTYMSSIYSIAKDQARSCGFVVIQGDYKFSYLFQTLNLQSRAFWVSDSELMVSRRKVPKHSQTWSTTGRSGQISTQSLRNEWISKFWATSEHQIIPSGNLPIDSMVDLSIVM